MIRWRFFVTRVLILLAILMLARWSMGPLIRYASIKTLETSVGAKANIAQVRVGFFPPRVQFVDVQVANPRAGKEMVNAFSAETIDLVIDGDELLKRRLVARDGRVSGIRIGSRRSTSGHIVRPPAPASKGPSFVSQILKTVSDSAEKQDAFTDNLELLQRSREIRNRWENDYADLSQRAKRLEKEIRQVRDDAKSIDNPLRDLPRLQATIRRAEAVAQESIAIRRSMDELPARIHSDWATLEQAKQNDVQRLKEYLPANVEGFNDLGPDLVRAMVRQQIDRVQGYLDSGRQIAEWTVIAPETERFRGEDVALNRSPLPPGLLLRRSEINGFLSVDGESFTMTGILENVTPHAQRLQEPMRARLRLEGPRVARVEFKRFYDEQVDGQPVRDQVTVHWPSLSMPRTQLGQSNDALLAIDGGKLELYVQVETVGEKISGRLVSKQVNTKIDLQFAPEATRLAMTRSLQKSLAEIDRIDINARFAGTWGDLDLSMATSLSDALADSVRRATEAQVDETKALLAAKIDSVHREQMQELQVWLNGQHGKASDLLAKTSEEIDALRNKMVAELPTTGAAAGRVGSLLKGLR